MKILPTALVIGFLLFAAKASGQLNTLMQDIERRFNPEELEEVLVGDLAVKVLSQQASVPLSRGVALLLVDGGYQGLTLASALQLSYRLNDWGWHTIIAPSMITLADGQSDGTPPVEDEFHPLHANHQTWVDFQATRSQLTLLMKALHTHSTPIKGFRLVISQGMTAAHLIELAAEDRVPSPDSLVVIAPFWPQREKNLLIAETLAKTDFPVLDINLMEHNLWGTQTYQMRKKKAATALKLHYRQRSIDGDRLNVYPREPFDSPQVTQLSKEIYGWVTYLGW